MGNNRFYTPDGFSDVLPGICEFKREAEAKLRDLFSLNGYSEIETPGIEYTDIYMDKEYVDPQGLYKLATRRAGSSASATTERSAVRHAIQTGP